MKYEDADLALKSRVYEFGEFRLEAANLSLFRNSEVVSLAPKACEVLLVLVESGNKIVKKEEILERVWADTFVEEANLTHHISTLDVVRAVSFGFESDEFRTLIASRRINLC